MKEFALIFRVSDNGSAAPQLTPAQIQERMTIWSNWMGGIAARNQLVNGGSRLGVKGSKTVSANKSVTDGPYVEVKEFINGYILVRANTVDEAVEMAKECPILAGGGKVEVRPLVTPENND
jgi:hypothetical protein